MSTRAGAIRKSSGLKRLTHLSTCAILFSCSPTVPVKPPGYSEIDIASTPGCGKQSILFHELRAGDGRIIESKSLPYWVKPGTYSVGVSCSWVRNDVSGECFDSKCDPLSTVLPYNFVLKPDVRYVFTCVFRDDKNGEAKYDIRLVQYDRQ